MSTISTRTISTRTISSLVGLGIFLWLCFGGALWYASGVAVLALLAGLEWVHAYRKTQALESEKPPAIVFFLNNALTLAGALYPLLVYNSQRLGSQPGFPYAMLLGVPPLVFTLLTARAAKTRLALGDLRNIYGLVGTVYIGLLFSSFVLLRGLPGRVAVRGFPEADQGAWLMLYVAMCVWATDTFAYFIGKSWGKRRFAPSLSPSKTLEGALGGLFGAVVMGIAFGAWVHLPLKHGLVIGLLAGIVGEIGDLFESALKREIGLKDFGSVMPGHGGTLDRFDSLLFVAPLAYLYLRFVAGF